MEHTQHQGNVCACPHHKAVPMLIVLFGLLFLLNAFAIIGDYATSIIWPILLILGGLMKIAGRSCKCC